MAVAPAERATTSAGAVRGQRVSSPSVPSSDQKLAPSPWSAAKLSRTTIRTKLYVSTAGLVIFDRPDTATELRRVQGRGGAASLPSELRPWLLSRHSGPDSS